MNNNSKDKSNAYKQLCHKIVSKINNEYLTGRKEKFCHECGQAIDWSEEY